MAIVLAVLAGLFGLQSNQNATQAETNLSLAEANAATAQAASIQAIENASAAGIARDDAFNAEATAQAERDRADEAAVLSFSRELAVQAKLNLTVDPERSILLAMAALDQTYTQEAENVLHEAVSASRVRLTLRGHEGILQAVAYSPDGKLIATAGEDKTARIWHAETGQELFTLRHATAVGEVEFSPDGARLAIDAADGLVRLWDVASGKELFSIIAAPKEIDPFPWALSMAFSPDGTLLATVSNFESQVKFWDPVSGAELFTLSDPGWLNVAPGVALSAVEIAFSPDGTRLAISLDSLGSGLGRIEVWDMAIRQRVQTLGERVDHGQSIAFNVEGTRLAANGRMADPPFGTWPPGACWLN